MAKFTIIYDYCSAWTDGYNIHEEFEGSWDDLQDFLKVMKANGCYNIDVTEQEQDG